MNLDGHLFETLARRVAGRLPAASWSSLFQNLEEAPVWTERKTLTLLFVEPLSSHRFDPRVAQLFDGQMEWLAARYHGIRDRFTPSGALVFFEQAANCVCMAMALQREAAPLRLRLGITTTSCQLASFCSDGEAFVTLLGAEDQLAARVAACASSGSMLISPSTYALVRDFVQADVRDCLIAEEYDPLDGATASITPTPERGGVEASTFAGLGTP